MGRTACTDPQCLYSTAITLLPLWAVQSVQSLIACTVQLYLYSLYGPYSLYTASVPVQYSYTSTPSMDRTACTEPQCLYSTAIPLLHLWAVQPVQYSYTSTPSMDRTACTEPQCLYSTAIPLLHLWAVQPVQCLYSTAIPLLPLWTVRPVQGCTLPAECRVELAVMFDKSGMLVRCDFSCVLNSSAVTWAVVTSTENLCERFCSNMLLSTWSLSNSVYSNVEEKEIVLSVNSWMSTSSHRATNVF